MIGYEFGDVVLVPFPFTDQSATKRRPAVVISSEVYHRGRPDVIIMAITSQHTPSQASDELLLEDWQQAGLLKPSLIKPILSDCVCPALRSTGSLAMLTKGSGIRGVMSTQIERHKLTYEDYRLLPDDGKRHELLDGVHYMSPSPKIRHQRISRRLLRALEEFLSHHALGEVFNAPCDVVLSEFDVSQPDLVFVAANQASIITEDNIRGIPTLVIEILSEGSRKLDETIKRQRYEHFGIPEYWIIDPELDLVKILRLTEGRYVRVAELTCEAQNVLTTPLLPDFTLSLRTLFQ